MARGPTAMVLLRRPLTIDAMGPRPAITVTDAIAGVLGGRQTGKKVWAQAVERLRCRRKANGDPRKTRTSGLRFRKPLPLGNSGKRRGPSGTKIRRIRP